MLVALHDPLLVLASFLAVFALLVGARFMAARAASPESVRRALHVATGLWTTLVSALFWRLGWALVPPLAFLAVNVSGKLSRFVPSLDRSPDSSEDRSGEDAPGTHRQSRTGLWTFPLGVALSYALLWVGRRYGQRRLRPLALHRTLEGSIAFFVVAAVTTACIAASLGAPGAAYGVPVLRLAIGCAAAGALAEAFAPPGWDNALIPVAVGAAYLALA